jgi:DNA-directed RNA polymerase specialized sigma24 family protein
MGTEPQNAGRVGTPSPAQEPLPASKLLARRLQAIIPSLTKNPGDEYLIRILCRHVVLAVRSELFNHALSRWPSYTDDQCQVFVANVFERLFAAVMRDARAGKADLREPVGYLIRLVNQVVREALSRAPLADGPLPLRAQSQKARYREGLGRAIADMDEDAGELLHLRLLLDLGFPQIAQILHLPEVAVRYRFNKAVEELRPFLRA